MGYIQSTLHGRGVSLMMTTESFYSIDSQTIHVMDLDYNLLSCCLVGLPT